MKFDGPKEDLRYVLCTRRCKCAFLIIEQKGEKKNETDLVK